MTDLVRRAVLAAAAAAPLAGPNTLDAAAPTEAAIPLWPDQPPGGAMALSERWVQRRPGRGGLDRAVAGVCRPRLFAFPSLRPTGATVLVIPGGGYVRQAYDHEGAQVARLLNGRGMDAYVLLHRLPGDGWAAGAQTPLQDAQRALRRVRARSRGPVGVLGFSAGGHVAGRLATSAADASYAPIDADDARPARPDFAGLIYPVVTMVEPQAHAGSRRALLGEFPSAEAITRESIERRVSGQTPPCFLVHAADDSAVPVANSLGLFAALQAQRVASELHVFQNGGHGFGLTLPPESPGALWPELFLRWSRALAPSGAR